MLRTDEVAEKHESKYGDDPFSATATEQPDNQTKIVINTEELANVAIKAAAGGITTAIITKQLLED